MGTSYKCNLGCIVTFWSWFFINVPQTTPPSLAITSTNDIAWWKCGSSSGPVVIAHFQWDEFQTSFSVAVLRGFKSFCWPTSLPGPASYRRPCGTNYVGWKASADTLVVTKLRKCWCLGLFPKTGNKVECGPVAFLLVKKHESTLIDRAVSFSY